jgi:hypothetical protein
MLIISRQLMKNHRNVEVDEKQILLFIKSAIAMPFFLFKKEKQKNCFCFCFCFAFKSAMGMLFSIQNIKMLFIKKSTFTLSIY